MASFLIHRLSTTATKTVKSISNVSTNKIISSFSSSSSSAAIPSSSSSSSTTSTKTSSTIISGSSLPVSAMTPLTVNWYTGKSMSAVPIPKRSELPPLPNVYMKKFRLYPSFRLRKVRKYRQFVPYISKLSLTYDPATEGTTAIQELRRQARGEKIRQEFPKCIVEVEELNDRQPAKVIVTWNNNSQQTIIAQHKVLLDIFDAMSPTQQQLQWAEEDKEMN